MSTLQPAKSTTDTAGDLFLSGSYFEIGISPYGNFGTNSEQTPTGYAQAGDAGVGLTYNEAGFGVNGSIPNIDFFTPGSPYESFAAGYVLGGTQAYGNNYKDGSVDGIPATSLTNTSSGSTLSATWVGVLNSNLQVTLNYSFSATSLYFTTTVTLTNLSGTTMSDVRYDREVDPDNTEFVDGDSGYSTYNTIVAQQPGSGASEVTAVSATTGAYYTATGTTAALFYYSTDPNSRVSDGLNFGGTLNPFDPLFTTGAGAAGSTTGLSDSAININYDGGPLAAGASTTFTYYTGLTNDVAATLATLTGPPAAPAIATIGVADVISLTALTITGTTQAGTTVALSFASTDTVAATVTGTTWSYTLQPADIAALGQGVGLTFTATATDAGGTSTPTTSALFAVETVPPPAPTLGESVTTTDPATPVIVGSGQSGDTITVFVGGTQIATTTAVDGTWTYTFPTALSAGNYTLTATATDIAGNVSAASAPLTLQVDGDNSYAVTTSIPDTNNTQTATYDPQGNLTTVQTLNPQGQTLTQVTDTQALINIYDTAGNLIGTITQPSTSASTQPVFDTAAGNSTATTDGGTIGSVVNLLSETNNFTSSGNDDITVHSGTATITATGPATVVNNLNASVTFYGGTGTATVNGGSGSVVAVGGAGGGTLTGGTGGNNVLVANGGTTTLVGVADGDQLFGSSTGTDTLQGGAGTETLVGGAGTETINASAGNIAYGGSGNSTLNADPGGGSVLVGGSGTSTMVAADGAVSMWAGSGTSTMQGGSGNDVMGGNANINSTTVMTGGTGDATFLGGAGSVTATGGTGNDTFWASTGAMTITEGPGNDTVFFGSGTTMVTGGAGTDLYSFIDGHAGGTATINGFKVGTDQINLFGYGANVAQPQISGGNLSILLSDHTSITLTGVTQLAANSIAYG